MIERRSGLPFLPASFRWLAACLVLFALATQAHAQTNQPKVTYIIAGQSNAWRLSHIRITPQPESRDPSLVDPGLSYRIVDRNVDHAILFGRFADPGPFQVVAKPLATLGRELRKLHAPGKDVEIVQMAVSGSSLFFPANPAAGQMLPTNYWLDQRGGPGLVDVLGPTLQQIGNTSSEVSVIWVQGESDANGFVSTAEYVAEYQLLVRRFQDHIGKKFRNMYLATLTDVPITAMGSQAGFIAGSNNIRDAHLQLHKTRTNGVRSRIVAHSYDLEDSQDAFHLTFESYVEFAERIATGIRDAERYFDYRTHRVLGNRVEIDFTDRLGVTFANPNLFRVEVGGVVRGFSLLDFRSDGLSLQIDGGPIAGQQVDIRHVHGIGAISGVNLFWHVDPLRSVQGEALAPFRIQF